jgi:DHA2 family methylenomycin A resistance protein-like MFS transporter
MTSTANQSTHKASFGWIVIITSLAFVTAQLDVSIVNIALPQIAHAFKADTSTCNG